MKNDRVDAASQTAYGSAEYKRSQKAYTIECAFEYFISLLVTDAFLAKLLRSMGADDALCGIISSFISLAMLFQLCALLVVGSGVTVTLPAGGFVWMLCDFEK